MRVLMINVTCGIGSTGRICADLADELSKEGHIVKIAYGRGVVPEQFKKYAVKIGNDLDVVFHALCSRLLDNSGFNSKYVTNRFIKWIKEFNPDVIHLHNLHGYYININLLFNYLHNCHKTIIWTLHDCWAFTGHCSYFDYCKCQKWKTGCEDCPQKKEYPTSFITDRSKINYEIKKRLFTNTDNMIIVTPSKWLSDLVKESFLKEKKTIVINNGIDINVFSKRETNLKQELGLQKKRIILGVASVWSRRKGLSDFIKLSKILDDQFQIILIGLSQKQIKQLPDNIIGIEKTDNVFQLAEYYSIADCLVNPTYEDNYPTVNLEAISCGTPVITYNTGGSPESAQVFGYIVEQNDIEGIRKKIYEIENLKYCDNKFDKANTIIEYMRLYK